MAASLEIIMSQLSSGSDISWGFWVDNLSFPREFPFSEKLMNLYLKKEIEETHLISRMNLIFSKGHVEMLELQNANVLISANVETKVEEACYLELISRLRDSAPNIQSHSKLLFQLRSCYLQTYESVRQVLISKKPQVVYLYNGRFLQERAAADCCAELGINVVYFERFNPSWKTKFFLFEKNTHSPSYRSQIMENFGSEMLLRESQKFFSIGEKWFGDREQGLTQDFTKSQVLDLKEVKLENYVVFFHSSEDELITTDLVSSCWGNQIEAVEKLVDVVSEIPNLNLVIRIHPNLKYKSSREIELWKNFGEQLQQENSRIIYLSHESKINSYELVKRSNAVITVGSTIGVEAAFLGKRSVLIGRGFHEEMGITLNPKNREELRDYLTQNFEENGISSRRIQAYKYAVFHQEGGVEFKNVRLCRNKFEKYSWGGFEFSRPPYVRFLSRVELLCQKLLNVVFQERGGQSGF